MKAIDYFKNFEEGDNITITADFINNVESLKEYIDYYNDILPQKNKKINELTDNQDILLKTLYIILNEMYE